MSGGDLTAKIIAGIFLAIVLFWLMNPRSQAPKVIGALSKGTIGTIQALQGYSPSGGGTFYGGGG